MAVHQAILVGPANGADLEASVESPPADPVGGAAFPRGANDGSCNVSALAPPRGLVANKRPDATIASHQCLWVHGLVPKSFFAAFRAEAVRCRTIASRVGKSKSGD